MVAIVVVVLVVVYLLVQATLYNQAVKKAEARLKGYDAKTAHLSYGNMMYVDRGQGEVMLSVHGIYGGYDQGFDALKDLPANKRIIAPSRFGYLGSSIKGDGSPAEQAKAFVELLDQLKIDKVFVVGESAGGTPAIRFALDYPERVKGLVLISSASPWPEKPATLPGRLGPPAPMNHSYAMWLMAPLFPLTMGLDASTIDMMLPLEARSRGADIDAETTNRDMAVHFDNYNIESLRPPVLLLHSRDDKVAPFADVEKSFHRYPNLTKVIVDSGGHMLAGHADEVNASIINFINLHA